MCSCALAIGDEITVHDQSAAQPTSGLDLAPAVALILPDLGGIVPSLAIVKERGWWERLAVNLLDAGLLNPGAKYASADAATMVCVALDGWLNSRLGDLRYIGMRIALANDLDHAIGLDFHESDVEQIAVARKQNHLLGADNFFLAMWPCQWNFVHLKKGFMALEAAYPGLGETVWHHIEIWLWQLGLNPVTPCRIESLVSMCEWYGEEDEGQAWEEAGYSSVEEYVDGGGLTRADFDQQMPPYVTRATKRLSWSKVETAAANEALNPRLRSLLGLVLRYRKAAPGNLEDVFSADAVRDATEHAEQINPCLFVRWTQDDLTTRVFDNYAEGYQQGCEGYYEGAEGFACFQLDDSRSFKRWMKKADNLLRGVRMMDQMMAIFEEMNREHE